MNKRCRRLILEFRIYWVKYADLYVVSIPTVPFFFLIPSPYTFLSTECTSKSKYGRLVDWVNYFNFVWIVRVVCLDRTRHCVTWVNPPWWPLCNQLLCNISYFSDWKQDMQTLVHCKICNQCQSINKSYFKNDHFFTLHCLWINDLTWRNLKYHGTSSFVDEQKEIMWTNGSAWMARLLYVFALLVVTCYWQGTLYWVHRMFRSLKGDMVKVSRKFVKWKSSRRDGWMVTWQAS